MRGGGGKTSKAKNKSPDNARAKLIKEGGYVEVVVSMPGSKAGQAKAKQIRDAMNELLAVREKKTRRRSPTRSKRSQSRRR
tara:strand:- start:818 stop:1060 length:243 start_codon:yes stop_codon:yes gene_type:complete